MREETKKVLCDLEERATKDLRKLLEGKTDFSPTEWESAGKAVDVIKDVEKTIKNALTSAVMEEDLGGWEDQGESMRSGRSSYGYYPMNDMTYGRRGMRSNSSYNNRHYGGSSYGGSSYNDSSYAGEMDGAISNLKNLMSSAKTDAERMMYQRFIEEAERERFGR